MSSAVQSVTPGRRTARSLLGFDLLFGILPLLLLLPMLAMEFQLLWQRTAMTFFPIPIFIVACLAAWQIRSPRADEPRRLFFARVSFLIWVGVFGVAAWRFSPFLAHCSLLFLFMGWATERLGAVPWPRIVAWASLLATSIRLPGEYHSRLQEWFVQQSSAILGSILDGQSIPYLRLANTFNMRGLEFSLSECCTSVYSINALVSVVVLLLLLTHRSLLVSILSLLTVPLWGIVQLVLVLLSITLLKHFSERDASHGLDRALVELAAFMVVVGCCWATTWFLAKLTLPVPAADSGFEPEFQLLNSIVCWPQPDPFAMGAPAIPSSESWQQLSHSSSELMRRASWVGAVCFVAIGVFSTYRVASGGFAAESVVQPIRAVQLARIQWKDLFPEVFDRLQRMEVTHEIKRIDGTDRGVINWNFIWQGQFVQLSVTLPFKNRPPLSTKYESLGWRVLSEQAKRYVPPKRKQDESTTAGESGTDVEIQEPWTELRISNELGGQAVALVTYHPIQDPGSSPKARGSSPTQNLEYQVVLFCESGETLSMEQLTEFYGVFHKVNEHLQATGQASFLELLRGDSR